MQIDFYIDTITLTKQRIVGMSKDTHEQELVQRFLEMWNDLHVPTGKIADKLGIGRSAMRSLIAKTKVNTHVRDKLRFDYIVSLYKKGMLHDEVATLTGGSPSYYRKIYSSVFNESQKKLKKTNRLIDELPKIVDNKVHIKTRKHSEMNAPLELIMVEQQFWFPNF